MKYVWHVINSETNDVISVYDTADKAKKLAPVISKKLGVEVEVEKRTINLPVDYLGQKR